jgi:UDP-glucuronate 4-epimerase
MSGAVVVTGAAGFLGSHVVEALSRRGSSVVGLDNFDGFYGRELKERNVSESREAARRAGTAYELAEVDITDGPAMRALFERVRPAGVIHLAAKAGVRPSLADPVGYARVNVLGTSVALAEAHRSGCGRVVIASSSSVYGNNKRVPFREDDGVDEPISPYASSKRACELLSYTHWHLTRMPTACLRFFTVYGPRQRPDLAIRKFLRLVSRGEAIEVFGDGSMSRDYTYVDDIVGGILSAYDRIDSHGYRVWNLGSDRPVRLDEMVAAVERVVGRAAVVTRRPMQPGDVDQTWADLERSSRELGYSPRTEFAEGLARQWGWMRESGTVDAI